MRHLNRGRASRIRRVDRRESQGGRRRNNLPRLVKRFEYVTFNVERLTKPDQPRAGAALDDLAARHCRLEQRL